MTTSTKPPRSLTRLFPKVKKVTQSKYGVEITVNSTDCRKGKRLSASACALANAAKRQYNADGALIGMSKSYIIMGNKAVQYATPHTVAREIVSFDRHKDFAPGHYALSPVPPSARKSYKRRENKSGAPRVRRIVHRRTVRVRNLNAIA